MDTSKEGWICIETKYLRLTKELSKNKILACNVIENDEVVFDYYKNRKVIGKEHKINSCTKSILSLLIGIAFDKGYLTDLDEPIENYFSKELYFQSDSSKRELTIYHLLTMTTGIYFPEWEEWNGFAPMVQGGDIIKFVLNRPLNDLPGKRMSYNSGCSHLLTSILQQATGELALDFARKYLFDPIGIGKVEWYSDNKGVNRGADGLRLTIEDMVKIGRLVLHKGKWKGKQIVSKSWINESTFPHHFTYENIGYYGYHWWTSKINPDSKDMSIHNRYYFALGFGGQYIIIVPKYSLIVIFVSEMYDSSLTPLKLFRDSILPSFVRDA